MVEAKCPSCPVTPPGGCCAPGPLRALRPAWTVSLCSLGPGHAGGSSGVGRGPRGRGLQWKRVDCEQGLGGLSRPSPPPSTLGSRLGEPAGTQAEGPSQAGEGVRAGSRGMPGPHGDAGPCLSAQEASAGAQEAGRAVCLVCLGLRGRLSSWGLDGPAPSPEVPAGRRPSVRARPFWEAPEAGGCRLSPPLQSVCPSVCCREGAHACWLQPGHVPPAAGSLPAAGSFPCDRLRGDTGVCCWWICHLEGGRRSRGDRAGLWAPSQSPD